MDGVQRLGQTRAEGAHRGLGQRAVLGDRLGERRPGHVTGRHPRHRRVRVRVQDGGGPLGADTPGGVHLAPEPGAELLVEREVGVDDLDRDRTSARAAPQVDPAHAARAEPAEQSVGTDGARFARFQRLHRWTPPVDPADGEPCGRWTRGRRAEGGAAVCDGAVRGGAVRGKAVRGRSGRPGSGPKPRGRARRGHRELPDHDPLLRSGGDLFATSLRGKARMCRSLAPAFPFPTAFPTGAVCRNDNRSGIRSRNGAVSAAGAASGIAMGQPVAFPGVPVRFGRPLPGGKRIPARSRSAAEQFHPDVGRVAGVLTRPAGELADSRRAGRGRSGSRAS